MGGKRKRSRAGPVESGGEVRPVDVEVDGSFGEGGGQVLRASVALSALTDLSVRVSRVRAARPKPGLAAQHLAAVLAVAELSGAVASRASIGSQTVELRPRQRDGSQVRPPVVLDRISGAGSTALVLQAVLPVILRFVPSVASDEWTALISGGTMAMAAPHSDYVENVLCPNLRVFGIELECQVEQHGFFPRGGGRLRVRVRKRDTVPRTPRGKVTLPAVELPQRGNILEVQGRVVIAGSVPDETGVEMAVAARKRLRCRLRHDLASDAEVTVVLDRGEPAMCHSGTAGGLTLWAKTSADGVNIVFGSSGLLERKCSPAEIAEAAADELCDALASRASVDVHMADQLCL